MRTYVKIVGCVFILLLAFVSVVSAGGLGVGYTSGNGIVPLLIPGNPATCTDMGCTGGIVLKIESGFSGTHDLGNGKTITITETGGNTIAWTSNEDINCIFMKGGNGGDSYCYNPPVRSDSGLSTPVDTTNNEPKGISHISICHTPGVTVPEFPSAFLPVTMVIGLLGAVFYIQRTREH
jgi:hypothetical protein